MLVDLVVVDPEQRQTYHSAYNPVYSGEVRGPASGIAPMPLDPRKVIARRAALELVPGAVCNLGLRRLHRHRDGRRGGGHPRRGRAHQRAGPDRRRAGERQRGGGEPQLLGDGRPALPVRLLRRRRPRHRLPLLRRSRRGVQRQREPLLRPHHRTRRLHQHQPGRPQDGVQRHLHRRRPEARLAAGADAGAAGRARAQVRARPDAAHLQRRASPANAARRWCTSPSAPCSGPSTAISRWWRSRRAPTSSATSWPTWTSARASPPTCGAWTPACSSTQPMGLARDLAAKPPVSRSPRLQQQR